MNKSTYVGKHRFELKIVLLKIFQFETHYYSDLCKRKSVDNFYKSRKGFDRFLLNNGERKERTRFNVQTYINHEPLLRLR